MHRYPCTTRTSVTGLTALKNDQWLGWEEKIPPGHIITRIFYFKIDSFPGKLKCNKIWRKYSTVQWPAGYTAWPAGWRISRKMHCAEVSSSAVKTTFAITINFTKRCNHHIHLHRNHLQLFMIHLRHQRLKCCPQPRIDWWVFFKVVNACCSVVGEIFSPSICFDMFFH